MSSNTTRRFPPFKVAALALACALASPGWVHATEDEQKSDKESSAMQSETSATTSDGALGKLAEEESDLATFVKAIEQAGMAEALEGGTYTIFAPTDDAFESGDQSVEELMKPENREQLVSLLRAHIVADDVDPEMAKQIGQARTVDGGTVELSEDGETLKVGDASVVKSDIQQGELRIYTIDQVLTPNPEAMAAAPQFEELDQDGDGFLSESELEGEESLAAQHSELDSDGDDRVSRTEFSAFEQHQQGAAESEAKQQEEESDDSGWFGGDEEESE